MWCVMCENGIIWNYGIWNGWTMDCLFYVHITYLYLLPKYVCVMCMCMYCILYMDILHLQSPLPYYQCNIKSKINYHFTIIFILPMQNATPPTWTIHHLSLSMVYGLWTTDGWHGEGEGVGVDWAKQSKADDTEEDTHVLPPHGIPRLGTSPNSPLGPSPFTCRGPRLIAHLS